MILLLLSTASLASRPDSGTGLYAFDSTDVLEYVDGPLELVRVHYSIDGPNETRLDDLDESGYPDFAEDVASTAEDVLRFYAEQGFRGPITEAEAGLSDLGGSAGFDFYLLDFGGSADGMFSIDGCIGGSYRCAGHMLMENDFRGYGYSSLDEAITVLTSHELFHAVQAAYQANQPPWLGEGTAVWAEYQYDSSIDDFYWFASEYLTDPGRTIDSPPAGAISSFSYGTALFFQFLSDRLGTETGVTIQEEMEGRSDDEGLDAVLAAMESHGAQLTEEWSTFARWNLATGRRAGEAESYTFAEEIGPIAAEAKGASIQDDNRFYPLAASYFHLTHEGGPLAFASAEDATGLHFSLHAVADGSDDGPVADALATWIPTGTFSETLEDLPAGGYWLVGSYPEAASQSVKIEFCLGPPESVSPCLESIDEAGDTGASAEPSEDGCGCAAQGSSGSAAWLGLGLLGLVRRRSTPQTRPSR